MSQRETLTNLEKAKSLKDIRKSLGWTQEAMADALGLDNTYLSQLENAKRDVDEWYVVKARGLLTNFENSNSLDAELRGTGSTSDLREKCHGHLNQFLDSCANDPEKLAWTHIELQQHFPLDKWRRADLVPKGETIGGVSKDVAEVARGAAPIALAKVLREDRERRLKQKAASTSENKVEQEHGADQDSKKRPGSPTQAPKQHEY